MKPLGLTLVGLLAVCLLASISSGTWAYFSDIETATGNTLTAGTPNLQVGTTADPMTRSISVTDVKPGTASTNAANWAIQNIGSLNVTFQQQ